MTTIWTPSEVNSFRPYSMKTSSHSSCDSTSQSELALAYRPSAFFPIAIQTKFVLLKAKRYVLLAAAPKPWVKWNRGRSSKRFHLRHGCAVAVGPRRNSFAVQTRRGGVCERSERGAELLAISCEPYGEPPSGLARGVRLLRTTRRNR